MPRIQIDPPNELNNPSPEPDFLMIHSNPTHVWIGDTHYIESNNRRAEPGKCYYLSEGKWFFRVLENQESNEDPVTEYGVENARDTVVVENVYQIDSDNPQNNHTDEMSRYQLETHQALSMGDVPLTPFDKQ